MHKESVMKILLFCDDYYHPMEISVQGMRPLEKKGCEIDIIGNTSNFDSSIISNYDVLVMSKCDHVSQADTTNWKTDDVQSAIIKYVENGGGLLVTHSGIVGENDNKTEMLEKFIGCRFKYHPNNNPVTMGVLKPHPVTDGVEIFCETDEHYQIEILSEDVNILAASFSDTQGEQAKYKTEPYFNAPANIQPCVYTLNRGKGRICVITSGHVLEVWLNPNFQLLLENAVQWCVGVWAK